jgi:hypothetical protein
MKTATPPSALAATPKGSGIQILYHLAWAMLLVVSSMGRADAQTIPANVPWHVLQQEGFSLDIDEMTFRRSDSNASLPMTKGNFAFSEVIFSEDRFAIVYTAGRVGDSTAMSSQSYWGEDAVYFKLSPTTNILRIETDGCPEYSYSLEGDLLHMKRHAPQEDRLLFLPQTTEFQDPEFSEAIIEDIAGHFDCKSFDALRVTIKTQASDFKRGQVSEIAQLQMDRATLLKAMLYSKCSIQPDQLQILSQVTYTDEARVTFEFLKSMPWMENDSLKFDIVPTMSASSTSKGDAYRVRIALTDKQKAQLNYWSQEDWLKYLHSPTSDFATSILLYAITLQDIPLWYKQGAHDWKQYGKAADTEKWEKYLSQKVPIVD